MEESAGISAFTMQNMQRCRGHLCAQGAHAVDELLPLDKTRVVQVGSKIEVLHPDWMIKIRDSPGFYLACNQVLTFANNRGMELHVRACSARNLLDKQTFGKQDPYCKLTLRNKSARTRVHDNGHKTPVWNEVFVFSVVDPQLDQLVVEVKDKNFTTSTLIGECRLPVNMFLSGSVMDQWYPLNNGSKRAGEINLRVQFKTSNVQHTGAVPVASTEKMSKQASAQAYPYLQQASYSGSQQYPVPGSYPASFNSAATTSAPQQYPPQQYPPPQPYYQQQPPQYSQPPPPQYAQPPALQYGQQPYYPPPPPAYGYPPPAAGAYAAGPPMMVVPGGAAYGHHQHHGSPRRHKGGSGFGGGRRGGGSSTGQMAMGVGAGVLGGMLLGEALDDIFD